MVRGRNTRVIGVRISDDLYRQIEDAADNLFRPLSVSDWLKEAIEEKLAAAKERHPRTKNKTKQKSELDGNNERLASEQNSPETAATTEIKSKPISRPAPKVEAPPKPVTKSAPKAVVHEKLFFDPASVPMSIGKPGGELVTAMDRGLMEGVLYEPPGKNDHCPCGSGKKYKRCCGVGALGD